MIGRAVTISRALALSALSVGCGSTAASAPEPQDAPAGTSESQAGSGAESGTSEPATDLVGRLPADDILGEDFVFGEGADLAITVAEADGSNAPSDQPVEAVTDVDPIVACDAARATGEDPLIDDFEDASLATLTADGREGDWYAYNSEDAAEHVLEFLQDSDGPGNGDMVLHTVGGQYAWSGIGFGLHWGATDANGVWQQCFYDASVYSGIRFWARGNGVTVRFSASMPEVIPISDGGLCDTVQTSCWNSHGVDVALGDVWELHEIPFSEMVQDFGTTLGPLDPTRIRTMQFDVPENVAFEFWLDDLEFVTTTEAAP